jgi:[ribosomal protein S5]-alanine N-acetyltransferase
MPPFTTDHLLLRPLTAADAPGMFALDSDPAVRRYLGGIGGPQAASVADSLATIAYIQAQYAATGLGRWAVVLRATGEFMGWAGLKLVAGPVNEQRDFYDLGYRFLPRYWGQGYATRPGGPGWPTASTRCTCRVFAPTPTCIIPARGAFWKKSG